MWTQKTLSKFAWSSSVNYSAREWFCRRENARQDFPKAGGCFVWPKTPNRHRKMEKLQKGNNDQKKNEWSVKIKSFFKLFVFFSAVCCNTWQCLPAKILTGWDDWAQTTTSIKSCQHWFLYFEICFMGWISVLCLKYFLKAGTSNTSLSLSLLLLSQSFSIEENI